MKIHFSIVNVLSYLWIAFGTLIFIIGWCSLYVSLPIVALFIILGWKWLKTSSNTEILAVSKRQLWCVFFLIFIITLLCGIGGYVVQSNDHYWRNAMFRDLVNYNWPVFDEKAGLTKSYYIAFWMVPAAIAKALHSMEVGFFAQLLWLSLGTMLMFLQICRYIGKARVSYIFFFYFFSGFKLAECLLYYPIFGDEGIIGPMLENLSKNETPGSFHAGPMSQLLYDPFNQTIPLFLGMMLMINNVKSKYIPLIFSLLLLYAPFPLVGLAPIVLYWFIRNIIQQEKKSRFLYIVSIENITALLILFISAAYLMSNNNSGNKGLRPIFDLGADVWAFTLYITFEFGILIAIAYKACKDKTVLWIAFGSTAVFGWFQIGLHNDFCFRTNMPLIFIVCILITKRYYMIETSKSLKYFIFFWYIFAGIPAQIHPLSRWVSSCMIISGTPQSTLNQYQDIVDVNELYIFQQKALRNEDLQSSFRCDERLYEFRTDVGSPDSFFFKYLARK